MLGPFNTQRQTGEEERVVAWWTVRAIDVKVEGGRTWFAGTVSSPRGWGVSMMTAIPIPGEPPAPWAHDVWTVRIQEEWTGERRSV